MLRILAIETSCDETAIAVIEASGNRNGLKFKTLSSIVHSQVDLHAPWMGVVPTLAKREHAINLVPTLITALKQADIFAQRVTPKPISKSLATKLEKLLARETGLFDVTSKLLYEIDPPEIDMIAVTSGPGLEPALWVGINFAKTLATAWKKPLIPVNHMNGHLISPLLSPLIGKDTGTKIAFPSLALLISGGHTEIIFAKNLLSRKIVGQTKDDAVGEAFDKVARMLDLPYPGGPQISKLAKHHAKFGDQFVFPRPMIHSADFDFSFSGLKTAVLYRIKKAEPLSSEQKEEVAYQFEEAATDVIVHKTEKALEKFKAKSLLVGGGVIANEKIRSRLTTMIETKYPNVSLLLPGRELTTDNALMIAGAAYLAHLRDKNAGKNFGSIKAEGSLRLS
ncbi:MAG: tRNA (adenosine(37)-N6)-threonylcarbamoyltransferase complex transferase subunit TsaD [Candidatus Paceibacterota bacterium]|jgi:N6-L-threonylcarbamoyladenine synthase